ncbi:MAG: hypothetical protein E5V40_07105 [Mesorhizobium sp.]|nr:MAG: hypothetical protein E5V40_07105 [Mesorhizobium sp.]
MSVKLSWAMTVGAMMAAGFPGCSISKRQSPSRQPAAQPPVAVSHGGSCPRCSRHCETGACRRRTII